MYILLGVIYAVLVMGEFRKGSRIFIVTTSDRTEHDFTWLLFLTTSVAFLLGK